MKNDLYHFKTPGKLMRALLIISGVLCLAFYSPLMAQKTYTYTGQVQNKQGELLPGVNVVVKGDVIHGTSTDIDGKFSISTPNPTETLIFSFVGSQSQEVQAKAGVPLSIVMIDKTIGLSELVVIGYGVQKKSVVTGAISSVKASDLNSMQLPRIETALQGRTSGVTIASSSGQPGASATVRIRGVTSMTASDPLYVIDGMPVDVGGIDYLNPSDIESIEVLKDAASAAIYGTRAASGVILVTTKKGHSGSMKVSYDAYFGTQAPAKKLKLLNATEYATLQNEAAENSGSTLPFPFLSQNPDSLGIGTDWQDAIFNNNAGIQNHELSISGGNDRSTYYASFGYLDQEGIVATDISHYKRLNLRVNSTHKIKTWLRLGNNMGYSHIKSQGSLNTNSEYGGPLASAINLDPVTPVIETNPDALSRDPYVNTDNPLIYAPNGFPYGISTRVMQEMSNPMAYIQTKLGNYGWSDNFVGDVYAEVEPIKGLVAKSSLGAKLAFWGDESYTPRFYLNAANSNLGKNAFARSTSQGFRWNFENTLAYTRSFGLHNVTGLVGTSAFLERSRGVSATYYGLPVSSFDEASMNYDRPAEDRIGGGWENSDHTLSSIFARLTYNYDERYLFTGIARRDGSSRFGSNNKYNIFPSASFGWVASKEKFWPENKVVNFLKVRLSYGVTGSEEIGDFRYVSMITSGYNYTFGEDNYTIGYMPGSLANPSLKWEETSQSNIGFDASLLDYFNLTVDFFNKVTTGILRTIVLPEYSGTGNPLGNVASMSNKGIEIELGYKRQFGELFLDLSGKASYVKNKITDLGEKEYEADKFFQSSSYEISCLKLGEPMGAFYGFEVLGVFHKQSDVLSYVDPATGNLIQPNAQPGDLKFADLDGDGKITVDDRKVIGNPIPTWTFGFTFSATYKGFDVQLFGQGVAGNKIFNGLRRLDMPAANWTTDALDRWTPTNATSDFPRLTYGSDPNKNFTSPSSFYLSDGAYLRIKTFQIGYTLPKSFLGSIGMDKLRFYVSSNNLFTLTKYTGYDPEIGGGSFGIDRGIYPQARSFLAGVNVTF